MSYGSVTIGVVVVGEGAAGAAAGGVITGVDAAVVLPEVTAHSASRTITYRLSSDVFTSVSFSPSFTVADACPLSYEPPAMAILTWSNLPEPRRAFTSGQTTKAGSL